MTTQKLPLGPSARIMVEEIIKYQRRLAAIHRQMVESLYKPQNLVEQIAAAQTLDEQMRDELDMVIKIFEDAERLRRQGMGGDDIYFSGGDE